MSFLKSLPILQALLVCSCATNTRLPASHTEKYEADKLLDQGLSTDKLLRISLEKDKSAKKMLDLAGSELEKMQAAAEAIGSSTFKIAYIVGDFSDEPLIKLLLGARLLAGFEVHKLSDKIFIDQLLDGQSSPDVGTGKISVLLWSPLCAHVKPIALGASVLDEQILDIPEILVSADLQHSKLCKGK